MWLHELTNPQLAGLRCSVITFKCDNPIQTFITQFPLWWLVFLLGLYGIWFCFPFLNISEHRLVLKLCFFFSPRHSCLCCPSTRKTLFLLVKLLLTQHSDHTGTVYWTMRCQVTHSLSHSHKPASLLPSVPFAVFAKRHLPLWAWRKDLWPFKQTQALNGLSVSLCNGFLHVLCVRARLCLCAHVGVSLCTDIIAVGYRCAQGLRVCLEVGSVEYWDWTLYTQLSEASLGHREHRYAPCSAREAIRPSLPVAGL